MKAIVNVNKNSAYAHLNGLTFEVAEILTTLFALDVNGTKTDFGHKEVIIISLQEELQIAYDNHNWGYKNDYLSLCLYARMNGIKFEAKYNCPA